MICNILYLYQCDEIVLLEFYRFLFTKEEFKQLGSS
jgi:hypothetical protein